MIGHTKIGGLANLGYNMIMLKAPFTTYHICIRILCSLSFTLDFCLNRLADGQFAGSLTDLCQVSTTKPMSHFGQEFQVHILQIYKSYLFHVSVYFSSCLAQQWLLYKHVVDISSQLNHGNVAVPIVVCYYRKIKQHLHNQTNVES